MGIWTTSDGRDLSKETSTEYQGASNDFEPLPEGSVVKAIIEEAKWDKAHNGEEKYISIKWKLTGPEGCVGRVLSQKLWVLDLDPSKKDPAKALKKRDADREKLRVIDANAKGRLLQTDGTPTDDGLALALTNASMVLQLMVYDMTSSDGKEIKGNWINSIYPPDHPTNIPKIEKVAAKSSQSGAVVDLDDDVPF